MTTPLDIITANMHLGAQAVLDALITNDVMPVVKLANDPDWERAANIVRDGQYWRDSPDGYDLDGGNPCEFWIALNAIKLGRDLAKEGR